MYRKLELEITKSVKEAIKTLDWEIPDNIPIEQPPRDNMGDIATSVSFELAKQLKRSPMEINQEILQVMNKPIIFKTVESIGPYLNFRIDYQKFSIMVLRSINENYGNLENKNLKIILEHTSANPNGPLHIGHIRNSIIGDSLARILISAGYNVETQYYVNDMGRQIAMIVWGLLKQGYVIDESEKSDHAIGKTYFQVNEDLKANPQYKNEVDKLMNLYESDNDTEVDKTFKMVVSDCLDGIEATSNRLKVSHDAFIWESTLIKDGSVAEVLKSLEGYLQKNEVLYLDLEDYGIEKELILTRSNGTSLYSTRDIAYHLEKSNNSDIMIDVFGSDHKLAVKQLKIALELIGGNKPEVIFYEFITLPEGSMSTRRGIFISVDELMEESVERAHSEIKKRHEEIDSLKAAEIAEKIGIGAIRYYIARLSPEKHIVFKWDDALSFERGCASIQYAHARACKLLEKAGEFEFSGVDLENILTNYDLKSFEMDLIKILSRFTSIIEESAESRKVHRVAQYSLDLASAFNKFYKSMPVIGSDEEAFRLLLVDKSRITIRNSLNLLGIDAPESM
ncbi:MAG: arginine--tRNA ligase [Methanobacterium sp.]|jgi:arginyl-tRNA synthetase